MEPRGQAVGRVVAPHDRLKFVHAPMGDQLQIHVAQEIHQDLAHWLPVHIPHNKHPIVEADRAARLHIAIGLDHRLDHRAVQALWHLGGQLEGQLLRPSHRHQVMALVPDDPLMPLGLEVVLGRAPGAVEVARHLDLEPAREGHLHRLGRLPQRHPARVPRVDRDGHARQPQLLQPQQALGGLRRVLAPVAIRGNCRLEAVGVEEAMEGEQLVVGQKDLTPGEGGLAAAWHVRGEVGDPGSAGLGVEHATLRRAVVVAAEVAQGVAAPREHEDQPADRDMPVVDGPLQHWRLMSEISMR